MIRAEISVPQRRQVMANNRFSCSRLDTLVQFGLSHYPVNRLWRAFRQRLGKVLGCCVLVVLHDQEGHPLLLTTQRGEQHVMMGLPTLIMRDAQAVGLHSVERVEVGSPTRSSPTGKQHDSPAARCLSKKLDKIPPEGYSLFSWLTWRMQ